jgi:hypothetical protein
VNRGHGLIRAHSGLWGGAKEQREGLDLPRFRRRLRAWVEPPLLILFFMSMKSMLVF